MRMAQFKKFAKAVLTLGFFAVTNVGSQAVGAPLPGPSDHKIASGSGETQPGGQFLQCLSEFQDPKHHNKISIRNNCKETLHVDFYVINVHGSSGSMTLRPGQSGSTGHSNVEAHYGFSLAACREGFRAVYPDGSQWLTGLFRCKRL